MKKKTHKRKFFYRRCPYCGTKINGGNRKLEKHLYTGDGCPSRTPINLKYTKPKKKKPKTSWSPPPKSKPPLETLLEDTKTPIPKPEKKGKNLTSIEDIDKTLDEIEEEDDEEI